MDISKWYKNFGNQEIQKFYHIKEIDNDKDVLATIYHYDNKLKKVLTKEEKKFHYKWWMEQLIKNNVHEISEQTVPFLLKF